MLRKNAKLKILIMFQILLAKRSGICYNHIAIEKWPCGQAVKTEPSQGSIPGSIPGRVTNKKEQTCVCSFSLCLPYIELRPLCGCRFAPLLATARGVAEVFPAGSHYASNLKPRRTAGLYLILSIIFCSWA